MDDKFAGMTVNERLYVSGLSNEFDLAIKDKHVAEARAILIKVELTEPNIIPILNFHGLL